MAEVDAAIQEMFQAPHIQASKLINFFDNDLSVLETSFILMVIIS